MSSAKKNWKFLVRKNMFRPKAHVKVSLSQQKAICEENERKLLLARREALQLGNFVQLFERYVAEYLVTFTR